MTDDAQVVEPESGKEEEPQEPKMFDADYVKDLRQEAASYRTKLRTLEQKEKDADETRLVEQKEWQTLAEQRAGEVKELESYKDMYTAMVDSVAESNTQRVKAIPESMQGLVPNFDDPIKLSGWLDANAQLLGKPIAPTMNGSAGGGERPTEIGTLSPEELKAARRMNITAKEYQEAKRG